MSTISSHRETPAAGFRSHRSDTLRTRIGVVGLGTMGRAVAARLSERGIAPVVWSRSTASYEKLVSDVASTVTSARCIDELFRECNIVLLTLPDGAADSVLGRGTPAFTDRIKGCTVVYMGTTSPEYSAGLCADVERAGGRYAELPVSGSREPARRGQLVGMLSASDEVAASLVDVLAVLCKRVVRCGDAPSAMRMKLAVNMHLIATVTSIAEAMNFARRNGLDTAVLQDVLLAGPMACDILRAKANKLVKREYATDASVDVILNNSELIAQSATEACAAAPLTRACLDLYRRASELGWGNNDMVAVIQAIEERNQRVNEPEAAEHESKHLGSHHSLPALRAIA